MRGARLNVLARRFAALCLTTAASITIAAPTLAEQATSLRSRASAYEHGEGVDKDVHRAVSLYCEAARMGDAEAQYSLGWIYANGRGLTRNDELAAFFFTLAARQGHPLADRMLRYTGPAVARAPECLFDIEGRQAFPDPTPEQSVHFSGCGSYYSHQRAG